LLAALAVVALSALTFFSVGGLGEPLSGPLFAAISKPVKVLRAVNGGKTGLEPAVAHRQITFRSGWLELKAA
jgi:hypothetical protein